MAHSEYVKITIAVVDNDEGKYSSRVLLYQIIMFGKKKPSPPPPCEDCCTAMWQVQKVEPLGEAVLQPLHRNILYLFIEQLLDGKS